MAHDVSLVSSLIVFALCFPLKGRHRDCWQAHICLFVEAAWSIGCDSWGRQWQQATAVRSRFTLVTLAKLHVYMENLSRLTCEDNVQGIDWGGRIKPSALLAVTQPQSRQLGVDTVEMAAGKTRPPQRGREVKMEKHCPHCRHNVCCVCKIQSDGFRRVWSKIL